MEKLKVKLYAGKLDKHSGHVSGEGMFSKADEHRIMDFDCKVASCVTARYYKGLSAHGDNLVIVRMTDE
jgi:hypothetical protein